MKSDIIGNDWTTRELREFIRSETQSVNYKFIEYFGSNEDPHPVVVAEFEKLKALGTGNVEAEYIGLGLTNKTKAELIQQARALQEAQKADIYTEEALAEIDEQEQQAYEKFRYNYGFDISEDEYHDMVETMGALHGRITDSGLGSQELVKLYYDVKDTPNKYNFVQAFVDTQREARGSGWTTNKFIRSMRERLTRE